MKNVEITLDCRTATKKGEFPLKAYISGARIYMSTDVYVKKDQWDGEKIVGHPRARVLNKYLENFAENLTRAVLSLKSSGDWEMLIKDKKSLRMALNGEEWRRKDTFLAVAERFISQHQGKRTKEIYGQTLNRMRALCDLDTLSFERITPDWLREFGVFLGGSDNGRAIHYRNIRAVFNYALDEEITAYYPFRKFRIQHEQTRKRSLSADDIRTLISLDLSGRLAEYRDTFILLFYLIGVNVADLWSPESKIIGGRLEYTRAKTHKQYSIKIEPEAFELIDRIGRGKGHILSSMDRYKDLHDYTRRLNEGLQRLGPVIGKGGNGTPKTQPLFPDLTTYYSRHSWATICINDLDIPKETVAAALGHEMGNRITAVYIDFDQRKVDDANRRLIDHIRKGMSPDTPKP